MARKPSMLNVREYITWVIEISEMYQKYGDCPALKSEYPKLKLVGKALLRKADEQKAKGNRKDLYVGAR
jgi:hypothetical protein